MEGEPSAEVPQSDAGSSSPATTALSCSSSNVIPASALLDYRPLRSLDSVFLSRVKRFYVFFRKGHYSTFFVTKDDVVYAYGSNGLGLLGLGHANTATGLREVTELSGKRVVEFSAGARHVLALTADGSVYSWGSDRLSQLGRTLGSTASALRPMLVKKLTTGDENEGEKFTHIATGAAFSLALSKNGKVQPWGSNRHHQQSNRNGQNQIEFETRPDAKTVQICCGSSSAYAVLDTGEVFAWGKSSGGRLGVPVAGRRSIEPEMIVFPDPNVKIVKVAAGYGFAFFLSDKGEVFSCGEHVYGQLGRNMPPFDTPEKVDIDVEVVDIACFKFSCFAAMMGKDGVVYICGTWNNSYCGEELSWRERKGIMATKLKNLDAAYCHAPQGTLTYRTVELGDFDLGCLKTDFLKAYDDKELSDITIKVESEMIYANRLVLLTRSNYFKQSLDKLPEDSKTIEVNDISLAACRLFVSFLYSDLLDNNFISIETAFELFKLADKYYEEELRHQLQRWLARNLSIENCGTLYVFAKQHNAQLLLDEAFDFAIKNYQVVVSSKSFWDMDSETFREFTIKAASQVRRAESSKSSEDEEDSSNASVCATSDIGQSVRASTSSVESSEHSNSDYENQF